MIRLQRTRKKGFKLNKSPNNLENKYVGRPTQFDNPYKLNSFIKTYLLENELGQEAPHSFCKSNKELIENYEWYLNNHEQGQRVLEKAKIELKNKNLVCWCNLKEPCHADILLKFLEN